MTPALTLTPQWEANNNATSQVLFPCIRARFSLDLHPNLVKKNNDTVCANWFHLDTRSPHYQSHAMQGMI